MGCLKLHILDEQYYRTEQRESCFTRELTQKFSTENVRSYSLFGEALVSEHTTRRGTPFKFTAKEFDSETGLYYFGARYFDPRLAIWMGVDPLWEKWFFVGAYTYTLGNPVRFIDPDGRDVVAFDEESQRNIRNTLTRREARFVRFDESGRLDANRLNRSRSTSENMTALQALANSEITFTFRVSAQDMSGEAFFDNSAMGGNYNRGVTMLPGAETDASPDGNVHIIVGSGLSERQQAITTAHEAFGHGYFFERTRDALKSSHTFGTDGRTVWDSEFQMHVFESIRVPTNIPLENQIRTVENQARTNFDSRRRR